MSTAGGTFSCRKFNIGNKVFVPSFNNLTYGGMEVVPLDIPTPAYIWNNNNKTDELIRYDNSVVAQNTPVRADRRVDGHVDQLTFWATNIGSQDITLFQIPTPIRNICH